MDRGERRARTEAYGARARRVHLRAVHANGKPDCVCEQSVWFFAKGKSIGCRCRRRGRQCGPKVAASLCHGGSGGLHPSAVQRIAGKRLVKRWLRLVRTMSALDVDL
jgi:hypothetical protein